MRLRLLRCVFLLLVGCVFLVEGALGQCSDCFAPGSDLLVPLPSPKTTAPLPSSSDPSGRRPRAQAGDVTAVTVIGENGAFSAPLLPVLERALRASGAHRPEAETMLATALTRPGLASPQVYALARTVTGLLAEDASPETVAAAITTYNATVEAASEAYLSAPPPAFVALRNVLIALQQEQGS